MKIEVLQHGQYGALSVNASADSGLWSLRIQELPMGPSSPHTKNPSPPHDSNSIGSSHMSLTNEVNGGFF